MRRLWHEAVFEWQVQRMLRHAKTHPCDYRDCPRWTALAERLDRLP